MKALAVIIATVAMVLLASETTTWTGFAIQLGAGAVLAVLFLIVRRLDKDV